MHGEFAAGRLSYAKVRALTRVAEPDTEEALLGLAHHATAAQVEVVVRGLRRVSTAEADVQHERSHLLTFWEDDGSLAIRGMLPPEQGAAFLNALDAAHDRLRERAARAGVGGSAEPPDGDGGFAGSVWEGGGSAEPPHRQTRVDALVEMAASSVAAGPAPERYEVVVHVDLDALVCDGDGQVRLKDGPALAPETARRVGCDQGVVGVLERGGESLSVGRRSRAVPQAIRRAVEHRDGGCRFPGCERRRFLDAHHIVHWAHGGETSKRNLVMLCHYHHQLVHEGGAVLSGDGDHATVRLRDGRELTAAPRGPDGSARRLVELNRRAGHRIRSDTLLSGTGERMDRHYVVSVIADRLYTPQRE